MELTISLGIVPFQITESQKMLILSSELHLTQLSADQLIINEITCR